MGSRRGPNIPILATTKVILRHLYNIAGRKPGRRRNLPTTGHVTDYWTKSPTNDSSSLIRQRAESLVLKYAIHYNIDVIHNDGNAWYIMELCIHAGVFLLPCLLSQHATSWKRSRCSRIGLLLKTQQHDKQTDGHDHTVLPYLIENANIKMMCNIDITILIRYGIFQSVF